MPDAHPLVMNEDEQDAVIMLDRPIVYIDGDEVGEELEQVDDDYDEVVVLDTITLDGDDIEVA